MYFAKVISTTLEILREARADHLVIGGVATWGLLGMDIDTSRDVDVLIRPGDADRVLLAFAQHGYATSIRDPQWIYKVARPDVTVDLIFRAGETIELDQEHLERSTNAELDGIVIPVPAPEDLAMMKVVHDRQDQPDRWYESVALLRRSDLDWEYLARRGAMHAPKRTLSLMLYAADEGIRVPREALARLAEVAIGPGEEVPNLARRRA